MRLPAGRIEAGFALVAVAASATTIGRLRQGQSDVITGVLFLLLVGAWLVLLCRITLRRLPRVATLVPGVTALVATTTLMMILLELVLRWGVGTRATYAEQNGSAEYRSVYAYDNPSWYHLYYPNASLVNEKTEFTHRRAINSIGLTEREVPVSKPDGEYRILVIGDSYAEGVGAAYDESWVKVFERHVVQLSDGRVVRTMNAGVSGSDVLLEYVLLRDRLARYKPDMIIAGLNNSDIADVITRGGMERFRSDGRIQGTRAPGWDWLYGISYITRHIVHDVLGYSWLLMSPEQHAAAQRVARTELQSAIGAVSALTAELGARFVLVLNPHEYEVKDGAYEPGFKPLADELTASHAVETIDLLDIYKRTGTLTGANSHEYYWSKDYHHNARGYALMGETIATEFKRRPLLPVADGVTHSGVSTR